MALTNSIFRGAGAASWGYQALRPTFLHAIKPRVCAHRPIALRMYAGQNENNSNFQEDAKRIPKPTINNKDTVSNISKSIPPIIVPRTVVPKAQPIASKVVNSMPKTLAFHLTPEKSRWGRLAVSTKWALLINYRPFKVVEKVAFFSYIVWGHLLWIFLGTTTFISIIVWSISKFKAEDTLARYVGKLVTKELGLKVVFEEAIMPDWKSGAIVLNKVSAQRRPNPGEDGNYTQFDLSVEQISVKLSVKRYLAGSGFIEDMELKGIRGTVDRRYLVYDPSIDPTQNRRKPKRGDFDFNLFKVDDLLVTVLQPNTDPFQVSIFSAELPRLRKQWLLYDMLNSNFVSGSFDNAMFSMHARQVPNVELQTVHSDRSDKVDQTDRIQRLRIDDVNVRHLNRGARGMFGWIESGTCDFLADIVLPANDAYITTSEKWRDLFERWQAQLEGMWSSSVPRDAEVVTSVEREIEQRESMKTVAIDLRVRFNNLRARAPLYAPNLNYWNNALIHPIIAYVNSRDTYIPLHCYVAKRLYDFDGSWTLFDSGLMNELSTEMYNAFARDAQDEEARSLRIKKVGFWSLQFMAQLVLLTFGVLV